MGLLDFLKNKEEETVTAPVVEETAPAAEEAPVEEAPCCECEAPAEEAAPAAEEAPAEERELDANEHGEVFSVRMNYHAGYGVYKEWPNGGITIHSGIGWFHPFGPSEYYGMACPPDNMCEEAKAFPLEKHFTDFWMENFQTDLFCIYRLPDGDIYAWDGIFAVRGKDPNKCIVYNSEHTRQDILVNVIVGGTGRYEGATGVMVGTAEGGGEAKICGTMADGNPLVLPETIMKDLEGCMRIHEKK